MGGGVGIPRSSIRSIDAIYPDVPHMRIYVDRVRAPRLLTDAPTGQTSDRFALWQARMEAEHPWSDPKRASRQTVMKLSPRRCNPAANRRRDWQMGRRHWKM
jgi:hypothetical protein